MEPAAPLTLHLFEMDASGNHTKMEKTLSNMSSTLFERERPERNWPNCVANAGVQYNFTTMGIALMFISKASNNWDVSKAWGAQYKTAIASVAYLGSMFGMCTMGYVGDAIGRTYAMRITCGIMVIFAVASGLAWEENSLAVFRFFLGFGVGGVYPLSAARASEGAPAESTQQDRDSHTGFAFIFQSIGQTKTAHRAVAGRGHRARAGRRGPVRVSHKVRGWPPVDLGRAGGGRARRVVVGHRVRGANASAARHGGDTRQAPGAAGRVPDGLRLRPARALVLFSSARGLPQRTRGRRLRPAV